MENDVRTALTAQVREAIYGTLGEMEDAGDADFDAMAEAAVDAFAEFTNEANDDRPTAIDVIRDAVAGYPFGIYPNLDAEPLAEHVAAVLTSAGLIR